MKLAEGTTRINVYLSKELRKELDAYASKYDMSLSRTITESLELLFTQEKNRDLITSDNLGQILTEQKAIHGEIIRIIKNIEKEMEN